jgi:hypothetical protein
LSTAGSVAKICRYWRTVKNTPYFPDGYPLRVKCPVVALLLANKFEHIRCLKQNLMIIVLKINNLQNPHYIVWLKGFVPTNAKHTKLYAG